MPYSENVKILNFTSFANKQLYFIRKNLIFFWNKTIERYLVLTMGLFFFYKEATTCREKHHYVAKHNKNFISPKIVSN